MAKASEREMRPVFLTAEWRYLAMLNYRVAPSVLASCVPAGTELDDWNGETYVSIVGFLFRDVKLLGLSVPFHRAFEEVNLRFYVKRTVGRDVRRGVTFIREIVPRRAIATVARMVYNEPYVALPMRHRIGPSDAGSGTPASVEYEWRHGPGWTSLAVQPHGEPQPLRDGSEEQFITEHYWGYTTQRDGGTVEYRVEHPKWRVWPVHHAALSGSLDLYGPSFAEVLGKPPVSAFLSEGSRVVIYSPERSA
jgi:uncharacterized protein YqjF (DUF2071 family)